jgi:hypothetical protein
LTNRKSEIARDPITPLLGGNKLTYAVEWYEGDIGRQDNDEAVTSPIGHPLVFNNHIMRPIRTQAAPANCSPQER